MASVALYVNGRLSRRVSVGILQRRVRLRVKLPTGLSRVRLRVTFQLGSGSRPENLTRVIKICRRIASHPHFTG